MSMIIKIYDTDTAKDIAKKIYNSFDVMASCSIYGFEIDEFQQKLVPKGEIVLKELSILDEEENVNFHKGKKIRKYKYKKDSIGGTIAQKIFTWEKRIVDSEVRYTIWRYQ